MRTPRVLRNVMKVVIKMAMSCWTERLMAYLDPRAMGGTIQVVGEIEGIKAPK